MHGQTHVGEHVLHFGAIVEAESTDEFVTQAAPAKNFFEGARLEISAVFDGTRLVRIVIENAVEFAGELDRILTEDPSQTCAVEYRTNFQSRAFEEVFRRRGIRYKLVGGFSFYNRAEVKDALAYVRLAMHPEDDISLLRVLNVPPRGIGKTTVDTLREFARTNNATLWASIETFLAG